MERTNIRTIIIILVLALVVAAGLIGWLLGRTNNSTNTNQTKTTPKAQPSNNTAGTSVKSLVNYTLPDAWSENTCSASSDTVYIAPDGTSIDCNANPSAPIKAYADPQNTTDCQQLKPAANTQNIRKHVCISLYISGHKSLKASTEYSKGASYKTDTTISDYYINTGKGVVAIEYTYTSANDYQTGFDQLAKSVKAK